MGCEVLSDHVDTVCRDERRAAAVGDVGEEWDDEQRLLGRVEEVHEEVAVDMPVVELKCLARRRTIELRCPEVDDEAVTPSGSFDVDAVLTATELDDGFPCLRYKTYTVS